MKNIVFSLVFAVMTSSPPCLASNLNAKLLLEGNAIYFVIVNNGDEEIPVSKRIVLDQCSSFSNLCFEIFDETGDITRFASQVNYSDDFDEIIVLEPGRVFGYEFDRDSLLKHYPIREGTHTIRAIFRNKVTNEVIYSNTLEIEEQ